MENNSLGAIKTHKTVVISEGKNECGSTMFFYFDFEYNTENVSCRMGFVRIFSLKYSIVYQKLCVAS